MGKIINRLNSVLSIAQTVDKNKITLLNSTHFERRYSIKPEHREIEEIIVTGTSLERDAYFVKVRINNSCLKDEFFGNRYYHRNKAIFEKVDFSYNPNLSIKVQKIQTIII